MKKWGGLTVSCLPNPPTPLSQSRERGANYIPSFISPPSPRAGKGGWGDGVEIGPVLGVEIKIGFI